MTDPSNKPESNSKSEQTKDLLSELLKVKLLTNFPVHGYPETLNKATGLDALNKESKSTSARNSIDTLRKAYGLDTVEKASASASARSSIDTLRKAYGLDAVEKASASASARSSIDALRKAYGLDAVEKASASASARSSIDALRKAYGLDAVEKASASASARSSIDNLSKAASKVLSSFNLYPTKSFESNLNIINYPNSVTQALSRDWQKIGNDLWKSALDNQLSDEND